MVDPERFKRQSPVTVRLTNSGGGVGSGS